MNSPRHPGFSPLALLFPLFLLLQTITPAGRSFAEQPVNLMHVSSFWNYGVVASQMLFQNDHLFFIADDNVHSSQLWISDGTAAGTTMLTDPKITPSFTSSTPFATNGRGTIYILRHTVDTTSGSSINWLTEFWSSRGTPSSTNRLATFSSPMILDESIPPVVMGGYVYFMVPQGDQICLVRSDGTPMGTVIVKSTPYNTYYLGKTNDRLFFSIRMAQNAELWTSNGTSSGTAKLADLGHDRNNIPVWLDAVGAMGSQYFFAVYRDGNAWLWKSDGTTSGTALVRDLETHWSSAWLDPKSTVVVGSQLYFVITGTSTDGSLWKTDGTTSGTTRIITPGHEFFDYSSDHGAYKTLAFKNQFLFIADNGSGLFLCTNDATTTRGEVIAQLNRIGNNNNHTYYNDFGDLSVGADRMLIPLPDQIWQSDGTTSGTSVICHQMPNKDQIFLMPDQKHWLFTTGDSGYGAFNIPWGSSHTLLWQSDGTSTETKPLAMIGANTLGTRYGIPFALCGSNLLYCLGQQNIFQSPDEVTLWSMPFPPHTGAERAWMDYR